MLLSLCVYFLVLSIVNNFNTPVGYQQLWLGFEEESPTESAQDALSKTMLSRGNSQVNAIPNPGSRSGSPSKGRI